MTSIDNVSDLSPRVQYTATAAQTEFDYPFPIFEDADLVVDVDGTTKTLTTDYTVSGEGNDTGGTVTFLTAMSGSEVVTIYRDIAVARATDIQQNGPLSSTTWNDELDKVFLILQQLEDRIGRAIRFPLTGAITNSQAEMNPLSNFTGKFLRVTSAGLLEAAQVTDSVVTLSAEVMGALTYPQHAAEVLASLTPTAYRYKYGDIRRAGADVDTVDNTVAIQNTVNAAAHGGWAVFVPGDNGDRYRFGSSIHCYYDATNNPNFPSGVRQDCRVKIYGEGATNKDNLTNSEYRGSVLEYTAATGVGLDVYDSSGTEGRAFVMHDLTIIGATTGSLFQMKYVPQLTSIYNVTMRNNANGTVMDVEDVWVAEFRNIWLLGDGTNGTAFKYDAVEAGGGNVVYENVNVEDADIGFDFGAAFDQDRTQFIKNHTFRECQAKDVRVGWRLRCGVGKLKISDCWAEGIDGATGRAIEISNMAGWMDDLNPIGNRNPGLIKILDCNFSWEATSGVVGIEIGDDSATETTDSVGNVVIDGAVFGLVAAGTDAIRVHNAQYNGYRKIIDPVFHNNGGQYIVIDDEAQYGNLDVLNVDDDGLGVANAVEDTAGADKSYWCARLDNIMPVVGTGTYDYSNAKRLPSQLYTNTTGGVITLTLPDSPDEFSSVIYISDASANDLTIDPGTLNLNGATTDLVCQTHYSAIHLGYDTGRGFVASAAVRIGNEILSDGDTGGAGSAGAGNQYVEIEINGSVYKVLHDGTV